MGLVLGHQLREFIFCLVAIGGIEDVSNVIGNFRPHRHLRHVVHGILHQVELASLPGDTGETGRTCVSHSRVIVTSDQLQAMQATINQRFEEVSPVNFRFAEADANPENAAFSILSHSDGDQHGAVANASAVTHLLVSCIENQIGRLSQGPIAPGFQFGVKFLSSAADLRAADVQAAQLLGDLGHFARRYALHIHFSYRQFQRSFAPFPAFQCRRVKVDVPRLRDA